MRRSPEKPAGKGAVERPALATATAGLQAGGAALPYAERIRASFGRHTIDGISAHMGPAATQANEALGSLGYASGPAVAFRGMPSLHTAAHEAAHVIQQRAGVALKQDTGQAGDAHERHADAVADAVVAGRSAEGLLDRYAGGAGHSVQRRQLQFQQHGTPTPSQQQPSPAGGTGTVEPAERRRGPREGPARSAAGVIEAAAWENPGRDILPHLTQRAARPLDPRQRETENHVCGAASLLAGEIMAGREATARFLERSGDGGGWREAGADVDGGADRNHRAQLRAIGGRLREGTATFGDLNDAQQRLYHVTREREQQRLDRARQQQQQQQPQQPQGQQPPGQPQPAAPMESGMSDGMVTAAARRGVEARVAGPVPQTLTMVEALEALAPGQTLTRRICAREGGRYNHFVTLGRRANGQPWFYNPDPAPGDAQTVTGRVPTGPSDHGITAALRAELTRLTNQGRASAEPMPGGTVQFPGATITDRDP